ncbi:MAG: beta-galactosidase [Kofleriaceae bacterium]
MEARRRTWFDDRGLGIETVAGARHLPFYAGSMHYWRVAPARWAACLRTMHELGLTIVETPVPWRVHEPERGTLEWTGACDLRRFVEAARQAGLAVVLRPGPCVNAELTAFGLPDHVLADPACQARTARDTPAWFPSPPRAWPVPSYASTAFRARVRDWYARVADVIGPALAPDGPVVALGVDHETHLALRLGAYDLDYHPDAIAWWHELGGFSGEPPRAWDPDDAARCAAWVRFKDQYIARALGELATMLDDVGLAGVARFHNVPPMFEAHYDIRSIQAAIGGPAGIDVLAPRTGFRELRRHAIHAVGNAAPVPIAFHTLVGNLAWLPPLDRDEDRDRERDQLLSLLACGLRGFNLYMAVERDRFGGAAIDRGGKLEPHAKWIAPLVATLAEVEWPTLRRDALIALVAPRADARFGRATNVADPLPPIVAELLQLGPGGASELGTDPAAVAIRRWSSAISHALDLAQVPYAIVDDTTPTDELARYRAVIVPTLDRVDRALWQRLGELAEARRTIVVTGPGAPSLDELGRPLDIAGPRRRGKIREGSLDDLPGLAADLVPLAGELSDAWQIERPDDVRAMAFAAPGGDTRLVFVVSDATKPVSAVLICGEARVLRDPFTHEHLPITRGKATIAMPPGGVRMLVVT